MVLWNPAQYLKFADHRLRPAIDLLARVQCAAPRQVYDLGCGPGNVTELLSKRWPDSKVVGVDNSQEMLNEAKARAPHITWMKGDIGTWAPLADVIYSNSALHWVNKHDILLSSLYKNLTKGGVLAVQMPSNFKEPSHTCVIDTIKTKMKWRSRLSPLVKASPVHNPSFYIDQLSIAAKEDDSLEDIDVWTTEYTQILHGENPVAEWTKGTWLKQFLDRFGDEGEELREKQEFEAIYRQLILEAYPKQSDGTTVFPFKRIFIVAKKKGE